MNQRMDSLGECRCLASVTNVKEKEGCVASLAVGKSLVFAGCEGGAVFAYPRHRLSSFNDLNSSSCLYRCSSSAPVKCVKAASKEDVAFSAHSDHRIRVWNSSKHNSRKRNSNKTKMKRKTLPTMKDIIANKLQLWKLNENYVQTRRHHTRLWLQHFDVVSSLALCEEQERKEMIMYSGSWDKTVKVWRIKDLKCVDSIRAHDDAVSGVCCVGNLLLTASADGSLKLWRRRRPSAHDHVATVTFRRAALNCLAVNEHQNLVYCGASDGSIECCAVSVLNAEVRRSSALLGHRRSVMCVCVVRSYLCSGSTDGSVVVWSVSGQNHSRLHEFKAHDGSVKCIAASEIFAGEEEDDCDDSASSAWTKTPRASAPASRCSSRGRSCGDLSCSSVSSSSSVLESDSFHLYSGGSDCALKLWRVPLPHLP